MQTGSSLLISHLQVAFLAAMLTMTCCLEFCTSAFHQQHRYFVRIGRHQGNPSCRQGQRLFSVAPDASRSEPRNFKAKQSGKDNNEWLLSVILKRNPQSRSFRNGNQLIFSKTIQRVQTTEEQKDTELSIGQLVQVKVEEEANGRKDQKGNRAGKSATLIGWGVYNPNSLYRVRMLCHRFLVSKKQYKDLLGAINEDSGHSESQALSLILRYQLKKAWETRKSMQITRDESVPTGAIATPFLNTDTYRLLNGEGDQLSGLAIDVIGGETAVIMSSAAWCEVHKSTILSSLEAVFAKDKPDMKWIWKTTPSRLEQDGYKSQSEVEEEDETKQDTMVVCTENGIKYATWPYRRDVQKTSVYCDQRENRLYVATTYCRDKRVLDLCCYHGGFSMNAILNGGCYHATGVDSSADAIETCRNNAELNGISDDKVEFIRADITNYLQQIHETQESFFDVVVLDPPKLAPSMSSLDKASRKYHALNRDAIKVIDPINGGLLMTCTCSAAMTQKDGGQYFLNVVQGAAQAAGREITLLRVSGAAPCHTQSPISSPAGNYLTAALFRVHPSDDSVNEFA